MGIATGLTAARMQEIIDQQILSGAVDLSGNLIMTREDGSSFNAGAVKGAKGDSAILSLTGFPSAAAATYVRLVTLDGLDATSGAHAQFTLSGVGGYGAPKRGTVLVHATQRGADTIDLKAWHWGLDEAVANSIRIYTKKLGTYLYEVWAQFVPYTPQPTYTDQSRWNSTLNLDSNTSVAPASLVEGSIIASGAQATDTALGLVELATSTEAAAGLDNLRAITPATLQFAIGETFQKAVLDPAYTGLGPAKVTFLSGGGLSATAYQWIETPKPWGNRVVNMIRQGSTWRILGHANDEGFGGKIPLNQATTWPSYNYQQSVNIYTEPRIQKLVSGIVVLSGLLINPGAASAGSVIATLPVGYRPDTDGIWPVLHSGVIRALMIKANGEIQVYGSNWITGGFLCFDGIAFPAAGVATWTDIGGVAGSTYLNGWAGHVTAQFGVPGFWKDPYGIVWYRGLVKGGTYTTDLGMFTVPSTHASVAQSHVLTITSNNTVDAFGFVSAFASSASPSGKVAWKSGSLSGGYVSLTPLTVVTSDAIANNPWVTPYDTNGWSQYATFTPYRVLRRADGLGMSSGLIRAGTVSAKVAALQDMMLPDKTAIIPTVSADLTARLDFTGLRGFQDAVYPGSIFGNTVVNAWLSLDGLKWMVGD